MEYQRTINREKVDEQMKLFGEKGMAINTLSDEQKAAFKAAAQPVYDEYTAIIGQETIDLFSK